MSKRLEKKHITVASGNKRIPGIVVSKSKEEFTEEQMDLLNKGLNYAIYLGQTPKEDIIMDIEAAIKFAQEAVKKDVSEYTKRLIKAKKKSKRRESAE